eukprot:1191559-Prymnesium_polylepis.2
MRVGLGGGLGCRRNLLLAQGEPCVPVGRAEAELVGRAVSEHRDFGRLCEREEHGWIPIRPGGWV